MLPLFQGWSVRGMQLERTKRDDCEYFLKQTRREEKSEKVQIQIAGV
jgi:hypothetical protein